MPTISEQDIELLTIDEICDILSIGKNRAYELLRTNKIKSFKIGHIYKVPRASIYRYIWEQATL